MTACERADRCAFDRTCENYRNCTQVDPAGAGMAAAEAIASKAYTDYQRQLLMVQWTDVAYGPRQCPVTYTCYITCPEFQCELPEGHGSNHIFALVFDDQGAQQ